MSENQQENKTEKTIDDLKKLNVSENEPLKATEHMEATLNNYGFMVKVSNPHLLLSLKIMDKSKPVADLGVAYGFTTKELLNSGFNVIANDLDEKHLDVLANSISDEQRSRLKLMPGNACDLEFEENSLSGIMALRWLYFINGEQLREVLKKFYKWLAPGGTFVAVWTTPYALDMFINNKDKIFEKIFLKRLKEGHEWPGQIDILDLIKDLDYYSFIQEKLKDNIPKSINVFTIDLLIREVTLAGFKILKAEYFDYDLNSKQIQTDGTEMHEASIICYKEKL